MDYSIATVSSKGQFTVPKAIRERLGLKPGDKIAITVVAEQGEMRCTPMRGSRVQETACSLAKHVRLRK